MSKKGGAPIGTLKGGAALLVTCDSGKEKFATSEVRNILNQVVEESAAQQQNGNGTEHLSVEQLLQQEVQQAADRTQQTFLSMNTDSAGLVIIKVQNPQLNPVDLVERIFNTVIREKKPVTKETVRIIPLQHVVHADIEPLTEALKELFAAKLPESPAEDQPTRFNVEFKRRHHDIIRRQPTIDLIRSLLPNYHFVPSSPQFTIVVQPFRSVCGISIVGQDPVAANDFNIRELQKKVTQADGENGAAIAPTASADDGSVSGSDSEVVVIDGDSSAEVAAGAGEAAMDRNEAVAGNKRGRDEADEATGEKEEATPNGKKAREETTEGAEEEKAGEGEGEGATEEKPSRRSSCAIM